jgi:hypothetical protein
MASRVLKTNSPGSAVFQHRYVRWREPDTLGEFTDAHLAFRQLLRTLAPRSAYRGRTCLRLIGARTEMLVDKIVIAPGFRSQ